MKESLQKLNPNKKEVKPTRESRKQFIEKLETLMREYATNPNAGTEAIEDHLREGLKNKSYQPGKFSSKVTFQSELASFINALETKLPGDFANIRKEPEPVTLHISVTAPGGGN